jgi:DNA-binding PadR family transcriptional regulator
MSELDGLGRFTNPSLLILTSLADGDKHGYAITKDVETFHRLTLGPGTLYGALARLEERGLITPLPGEARRRPYRLTGRGAEVLRERLSELAQLASVAEGRLALS